MARRLNLTAPDIGTPDGDRPDGFYLDEGPGDPGTPILADLKNDIYYFFNKMMDEAGITYNNVVDTQTLSQYFDAMRASASKPETETVSTSQTLTIGSVSKLFTGDTSISDLSLIVPVPSSIGQAVTILCDGSGLIDVDFPGKKSTGNIYVSDGYSLKLIAKTLTEWDTVLEKTALIEDHPEYISVYSDGYMVNEYTWFSRPLITTTSHPLPTHTFGIPFVSLISDSTGTMCVKSGTTVTTNRPDYEGGTGILTTAQARISLTTRDCDWKAATGITNTRSYCSSHMVTGRI